MRLGECFCKSATIGNGRGFQMRSQDLLRTPHGFDLGGKLTGGRSTDQRLRDGARNREVSDEVALQRDRRIAVVCDRFAPRIQPSNEFAAELIRLGEAALVGSRRSIFERSRDLSQRGFKIAIQYDQWNVSGLDSGELVRAPPSKHQRHGSYREQRDATQRDE